MNGPPRRSNWPVSPAHVGHRAVSLSVFYAFNFHIRGALTDDRQTLKWSTLQEVRQIMVGVLVLVKWLMISIRQSMKLAQEIWLNAIPHLLHNRLRNVQLFCKYSYGNCSRRFRILSFNNVKSLVVCDVSLDMHRLSDDGWERQQATVCLSVMLLIITENQVC